MVSVRSLGLSGISGYEVTVECFLSGGLPAFDVVGLPDTAVREARERVRAAVKTCGARFPVSRITVNLAPAEPAEGGHGLRSAHPAGAADGRRRSCRRLPQDAAFLGELSLTGALRRGRRGAAHGPVRRPVRHPQALSSRPGNAAEATLADGAHRVSGGKCRASCWRISGARRPSRRRSGGSPPARRLPMPDFSETSWDRRT